MALAGAACLAAAVFAGALLWRSVLTSDGTSTPTPTRVSTPTEAAAGASATKLPPAPADDGPAEGGLTDPELRSQVWSTILSFYANVRGCADVLSSGIRVNQQPDAAGSWEETWDVSACGEPAALKIQFTVAPDGGIFYDITE
jgi:hypothetical protein